MDPKATKRTWTERAVLAVWRWHEAAMNRLALAPEPVALAVARTRAVRLERWCWMRQRRDGR